MLTILQIQWQITAALLASLPTLGHEIYNTKYLFALAFIIIHQKLRKLQLADHVQRIDDTRLPELTITAQI